MNKFLIAVILVCFSMAISAQGLLDELNEDTSVSTIYTTATFKDTRIVNLQSNETAGEGILHFVIAHRFGRLNEGAYTLWGLDNAMMRMGFDYGINERLAIGVGRSTHEKTLDANIKAKILRQSTGAVEMPISLTWYSSLMCNGLKWANPDADNLFIHRLSYVHQAIITKKINKELSLAFVPSLVHRNLVDSEDSPHDQFVLGIGGRYKLNTRISINSEYNYRINTSENDQFTNGLSLGVDIETGGHVFQLHLTNSKGMYERSFLTENTGTWLDGDIFFGFNMSRVFKL